MTQAQILQAQVMYNFFSRLINPWEAYTDAELKKLLWIAQEEHDGKKIAAIKFEMNRRVREA